MVYTCWENYYSPHYCLVCGGILYHDLYHFEAFLSGWQLETLVFIMALSSGMLVSVAAGSFSFLWRAVVDFYHLSAGVYFKRRGGPCLVAESRNERLS